MGRNSQYVSLYTIQSGIICGPQFATFCTIQFGFACGSQIEVRSVYTIQSGIAGGPQCVTCYTIRSDHNSQCVSLDTIQSGIPCGPQFPKFYTIQVGSACRSHICNTFHCIPHSLVSLVVHNLLRFIPYSRESLMCRNSQCFRQIISLVGRNSHCVG